ncbi:MAG: thiamine diphosphokinase [Clostridia bacterium]|nr:thiamine diphosphokinase [Clostridia bacterium]
MREIPFKAALFDLDGTLLDSLYVWKHIDVQFFASRNMSIPEGYGRAVAGLSYRECAEYTVKNYLPEENWQDIVDEWMRMAADEYACRVPLKPGGRGYLRMLRRAGVKLAVTTSMPETLFRPCLEHLGIVDLFDTLCSTEDTGGRGKAGGEVFLLAAERLGVKPEDCAVFEDVLDCLQGAKKAGMRAYCVKDKHSEKDFPAIAQIADGMLDTLDDMRAVHDFDVSPRCVVFTAYCEGDPRAAYVPEEGDFVLCADGGWKLAQKAGVRPDLVIGDFDSAEAPDCGEIERHPVMKADTDTMLCLKHGLKLGYERFLFVGGMGGRLDHTLANLQTLAYAAERGAGAEMSDEFCRAVVVRNGTARIRRRPGKLSVFALSDRCTGIDLTGTVWELHDAEMTDAFPLGVSNEYAADEAVITVRDGALLIVQTDD